MGAANSRRALRHGFQRRGDVMNRNSLVRMLVLPLFPLALGVAAGCGAIDNAGDDSSSAVTIIPPKQGTVFIKKTRLQDYDGDGKADQVVYRPKENTWYVHRS